MTTQHVGFNSPLASDIEAFLAHKRALGCHFVAEEKVFRLFDRYLFKQCVSTIGQITPELVDGFLTSRPRSSARSYNHLLGCLRRLFEWLLLHELIPLSPLRAQPRRGTPQRRPFLFDKIQARRLLDAAARLPDRPNCLLRGETYRTIYAMLYGLGLRVGEISRLRREDMDLDRQLLIIHQTKFSKSRLVPFGPRISARLCEYLQKRGGLFGALRPNHAVFSFSKDKRKHICANTISSTFHKLVATLNLAIPAGVVPPHLHCLRHSFAVGTLLRWYKAGIDPSQRLLHLSTFLGHVSPSSTAVYLTITEELLREASDRYEHFVTPLQPFCPR